MLLWFRSGSGRAEDVKVIATTSVKVLFRYSLGETFESLSEHRRPRGLRNPLLISNVSHYRLNHGDWVLCHMF